MTCPMAQTRAQPGVQTVAQTLAQASQLQEVSDTPLLDCQLLLAKALGKPRHWLLAWDHAEVPPSKAACFQALFARRRQGEPLAYLLGEREFWGRRFKVTQATLVPRPETELLVDTALALFDAAPRLVADLGTGSGALAVTLALERPAWQLLATDLSFAALQIAKANAAGASNLMLVQADWLTAFRANTFDLLVSNPPYIATDDPHLPALSREPQLALVADEGGLGPIRRIATQAAPLLKPEGALLLEHGYDQGDAVLKLLRGLGYTDPLQLKDLQGQPRATLARKGALPCQEGT